MLTWLWSGRHATTGSETPLRTACEATLSARGVYREPWKDEGQRTDRENEFNARRDQHKQERQEIEFDFEIDFDD